SYIASTLYPRLLLICAVFVAFPVLAWGRPVPNADANDAIFSSTQVILVSHSKDDNYLVEETFFGSLKPKETVSLKGFKVVTWAKFGDPEPVKTTERMRILLLLRPDEKDSTKLVVTDYGDAFFYRDAEKIGELR